MTREDIVNNLPFVGVGSDVRHTLHPRNKDWQIDVLKLYHATNKLYYQESVDMLGELAKDEDPFIRAGVARNLFTTNETLLELSKDKDELVRECAEDNPNMKG